MYRIIPIYSLLLLLTSCATIINRPFTTIHITAPSNCEVSCRTPNSTEPEIHSSATADSGTKTLSWLVKRSNSPLLVHTVQGVRERDIIIEAHRSAPFYGNLMIAYGIGFFIDYWNPKSWGYPRYIRLTPENYWTRGYKRITAPTTQKNEICFAIPFTYVSAYRFNYLHPYGSVFSAMLGYNYWYDKKQYLSIELNASQKPDLRLLNGKSIDNYLIQREKITSTMVSISNFHHLGRLDLGYGITAGIHSGRRYFQRWKMLDTNVYNLQYISLGAQAAAQLKLAGPMYMALSYQPQFLQLDKPGNFLYEHQFNVGIIWRVGIGQPQYKLKKISE